MTKTLRTIVTLDSAEYAGVISMSFDPTGDFLFLGAYSPNKLVIMNRNGVVVQSVAQGSYLKGIAFHTTDTMFVVTTGLGAISTRIDFPNNDYSQTPTITIFASGAAPVGLNSSQVGPDSCLYVTHYNVRYSDGTVGSEGGISRICSGFAPILDSSQNNKFVYVAFGDSFQSGEGSGNHILNTTEYLTKAYEDGSNYQTPFGPQVSTYTQNLGGNSCHRALANYAKLNRDRLKPGADVILIDMTCSGAKIEPGDQPPIVGTVGAASYDAQSQVQQALDRLNKLGLTVGDVNLVTVGMGGNDAKFSGIIQACLAPNLLRRTLQHYPSPPGEIDFLVNQFATCQNADALFTKSGEAIDQLADRVTWAQGILLNTFSKARILQLNYPNFLPAKAGAPAWCGGVRKEDLDFARGKAAQIDKIIADALRATAARDSRLELVNMENSFGANGLCPSSPDAVLANGIDESLFDTEVQRLLNLTSTGGDPVARALLDTLVTDYQNLKQCLRDAANPFGTHCNPSAAWNTVAADGNALLTYLQSQLDKFIVPNLVAPPSSPENANIRFDRSRGFFHPNAKGFVVMACNVRAAYNHGDPAGCLPSATTTITDVVNNNPVGNAPIPGGPGLQIRIRISGFDINIPIRIIIFSTPLDLGTVTSDGNGVVDTTVTLPDLGPGVHTLLLQGNAPGGVQLAKRIRINYPGRPSGDGGYAVYLSGFTHNTGDTYPPEQIDISYLGLTINPVSPDEDGGVFLELPLFDFLNQADPFTVTATSRTTGRTITTTIDPVPSVAGLWATGTQGSALTVTGSGTTVTGRVHSNAGITINGSQTSFTTGIEYGTTMVVSGSDQNLPSARKVIPADAPHTWQIADFRPGGREAIGAGTTYHAIPQAACVSGVWNVSSENVPSGIVYVPCAVTISGSNRIIKSLIVAEGAIQLSGNNVIVGTGIPGAPAMLTAATGADAIKLNGDGVRIEGTVQALNGGISIAGTAGVYRCGVIGQTITISGAQTKVTVDEQCRVRDTIGAISNTVFVPLVAANTAAQSGSTKEQR